MPGLGRRHAPDARDARYPMRAALPKAVEVVERYWDDNYWWGDQGDSPYCVGYSWAHWLEDAPVTHVDEREDPPVVDPLAIYEEALRVDEWEGEDYEGTSVRAGAKVLQSLGYIAEYRWAYDASTVAETVLTVGPVVLGTVWTADMFYPDVTGTIFPTGDEVGGHAYVLNGFDARTGYFRIKNSWGQYWGLDGHAFIHIDDVELLLRSDGEACLALEIAIEQEPEPEPIPEPEPEPVPEPEPIDAVGLFARIWAWCVRVVRSVFG